MPGLLFAYQVHRNRQGARASIRRLLTPTRTRLFVSIDSILTTIIASQPGRRYPDGVTNSALMRFTKLECL